MSETSTQMVVASLPSLCTSAHPAARFFGMAGPDAQWLEQPLPEWYLAAPEPLRKRLRDSHRCSLFSLRMLASQAFNPSISTAPGQPIARACMNYERDIVDTLAHIALMKAHIGEAAHAMLMDMLKPERTPRWDEHGVRYRQLRMLDTYAFSGSLLHGVLLVQQDRVDADNQACLVYMPGEPEHPLREYPCLGRFVERLAAKLLDRRYQVYFQRFIRDDQSPEFFVRLNERLSGAGSSDVESLIQVHATSTPPFEGLYEHRRHKLHEDAPGDREQSPAIRDTRGHVRSFWGAPHARTDHRQPEQDCAFAMGCPPAG
ncbi:dermonecrotic toxin domain-containing protein [Pseudomonas sp. Pseusp122]|uniref:dermonecrotic toxin domain-containing protein n=1 Tax=unclassified Pseudomonas TaxID=196821 RepID=UPI0039A584ED